MALYAFDGTWNSGKEKEDPTHENTNVFRFFEAYKKHSGTNDFYVPGVGTRFDTIGAVLGGVFGLGELPRINEAYARLCANWAEDDHVIDIVGFSRGAATTLDFSHRIQEDGIRRPGTDEVVEENAKIRFLGVFDVVAAFGLANLGNIDFNIGHHLSLPKANLQFCFHALALDERRPSFLPTRLHGAYEVWFRGVHSDVGGGNGNRGLNDITLTWMMNKAKAATLPITDEDIAALSPKPETLPSRDHRLPLKVRDVSALDRRHGSVLPLADWTNPPDTCPVETPEAERQATELGAQTLEVLTPEARGRIEALWKTAEDTAKQLDFPIKGVADALLTLFQGRVRLIANDAQLAAARVAVTRLVTAMIASARRISFHELNEFFLNQALFDLNPLSPFTD